MNNTIQEYLDIQSKIEKALRLGLILNVTHFHFDAMRLSGYYYALGNKIHNFNYKHKDDDYEFTLKIKSIIWDNIDSIWKNEQIKTAPTETIVIGEYFYKLSTVDQDIKEGEWCFERHLEYPCKKIRFLDEKDPSMSWYLRELNMDYLAEKPEPLVFYKTFDGSCRKLLSTNNPNITK